MISTAKIYDYYSPTAIIVCERQIGRKRVHCGKADFCRSFQKDLAWSPNALMREKCRPTFIIKPTR